MAGAGRCGAVDEHRRGPPAPDLPSPPLAASVAGPGGVLFRRGRAQVVGGEIVMTAPPSPSVARPRLPGTGGVAGGGWGDSDCGGGWLGPLQLFERDQSRCLIKMGTSSLTWTSLPSGASLPMR